MDTTRLSHVAIRGHKLTALSTPRDLRDDERGVLKQLVRHAGQWRVGLESQLPHLRVVEECPACPTVRLAVAASGDVVAVPEAPRIAAEGATATEEIGKSVNLLLHVADDGFVVELEVYRDDGTPVEHLPTPEELAFDH